MRLVTFQPPHLVPEPGILRGDEVISLTAAGYPDLKSAMRAGAEGRARMDALLAAAPPNYTYRLASVKLLAPIPHPPKIICVGLNYKDHALEAKMEIPTVPVIFSKFGNTITNPGDPIVLPRNSAKPDYEAEFAFVIGPGGRHIPAERWREHVYGYTCVNDVSARDFQLATSQWLMGKTFDTFAPCGPHIVTADEIPDPHHLDIRLLLNGEVMQNSNTSNLIFGIPELIAHLSSVMTLECGDIVSTGTPAGVGFSHKPPRWLRPGDHCVVEIQGIGRLENPVIAEA
jgi:2-keto-4-pentenoate hydratase/2-oxohepta-3-ene-1,7-dioic acid hydratase in catechol pathway